MFGPHVNRDHAKGARPPMAQHIEVARAEAAREGVTVGAVAFFVTNPKTGAATVDAKEAKGLKEYLGETGIRALVHGAYKNVPWKGNPHAGLAIRGEARLCLEAGAAGLVVHLPSAPPAAVCRWLPRLFVSTKIPIYLETPAVKPAKSWYETPAKLAALFREVHRSLNPGAADAATPKREKADPVGKKQDVPKGDAAGRTGPLLMGSWVRLCIDTAHIWACGADIGSYEKAETWLRDLEAEHRHIPPARIAFHLNDNVFGRGSGRDEHAPLLQGAIWRQYRQTPERSGLAAFVAYAKRHDIMVILERSRHSEGLLEDYRVLHAMGVK